MAYTVSFDTSLKVKRNDLKGYLLHNARDTYDGNLRRKNKDIKPAMTASNITMVNDGQGGFRECKDIDEIEDYVNRRISKVKSKRKLRKDAVLMRGIVMQLDPDYVQSHTEDEVKEHQQNMIDWAVNRFGQSNIAYTSIHNDETNPHIHMGFIPMTEDMRLSQIDWFPGRADLAQMHDSLRDYLRDRGYDAMRERVTGARKRLTVEEYKAFKDAEQKIKSIDEREASLNERESELIDREAEVDEKEEMVDKRYKKVVSKERKLKTREEELLNKEQSINSKEKALKSDLNAYNRRMIDLKQREDEYELKKERLTEDLQADYYKATEHLEAMFAEVEKQKDLYLKAGRLSDVSLGRIRMALSGEFRNDTIKIMKCIEDKALSDSDKQRIAEFEKSNNIYNRNYGDVDFTINNRKKRRPLSEGLDWGDSDKDDYDYSL